MVDSSVKLDLLLLATESRSCSNNCRLKVPCTVKDYEHVVYETVHTYVNSLLKCIGRLLISTIISFG